MITEFTGFPKIARLNREIIVTEKINGTNAQIFIDEEGTILAGSRNRWITPAEDNYGFAGWVERNRSELLRLGPGRFYGEWWGNGIQCNYGQSEKIFSLFRAPEVLPECCRVVPTLYRGGFSEIQIVLALSRLAEDGSVASPGFKPAEGVIVYHVAARTYFKVTLVNDETPKGRTVCAD